MDPTVPEPAAGSPIHPITKLPLSNGLLKRHAPPSDQYSTIYKECLKNHAAKLGSHAVDGCGEFMPCSGNNKDSQLKCAACGCHRNFHRRLISPPPPSSAPLLQLEYNPHHRHRPPSPRRGSHSSSPASNTSSPPPISSSYHHVIYPNVNHPRPTTTTTARSSRKLTSKRFRTRFTPSQKEDMLELAERVGWRMVKRDNKLVSEVCGRIGVEKGVFRVWMHNNKKPRRRSNCYNFANATSAPTRTYTAAAAGSGANGGFSRDHGNSTTLDDVKEEEENVHNHRDDDDNDGCGDDSSSSANVVVPVNGTNYGSSCSS